jgi:hypothetical protein
MNGYRSHLLCRPFVSVDAKEKQSRWQVPGFLSKGDKLLIRLSFELLNFLTSAA